LNKTKRVVWFQFFASLGAIAIVVALLGVTNALYASILERTRDALSGQLQLTSIFSWPAPLGAGERFHYAFRIGARFKLRHVFT
jgi:hypothetical protein